MYECYSLRMNKNLIFNFLMGCYVIFSNYVLVSDIDYRCREFIFFIDYSMCDILVDKNI